MSRLPFHFDAARYLLFAPGMRSLLHAWLGTFAVVLGSGEAFAIAGTEGSLEWRRVGLRRGVGSQAITALAVDPRIDRIAVGGADGVSFYAAQGRWPRIARVGPVRDLAFASDGSLLIAAESGLWRFTPDEGLKRYRLSAGDRANRILRVAVSGAHGFASTEAGVFASLGGKPWRLLSPELPIALAGAMAARALPGGALPESASTELLVVVGNRLWRVTLSSAEPAAVRAKALAPVHGIAAGSLPVQVVFNAPEFDTVLVYRRSLAARRAGSERFEVVRPAGVVGTPVHWLAADSRRYWLATATGLLRARAFSGPWWRAEPPAGGQPAFRVVVFSGRVFVASSVGLFEGVLRTAAGLGGAAAEAARADPDIRSVQRRVLEYLGLGPERFRTLRAGVDRRGWWPTVQLRFGALLGRQRGHDHDQSFSYGEFHALTDRDAKDERDLDVAVELRWDLGDLAFDPLAIDVSREARQRIALRDDVLEQVNQLYFERRAALERLRGLDPQSGEGRTLALRAEELAAGLDGWTGGWFRSGAAQPLQPP